MGKSATVLRTEPVPCSWPMPDQQSLYTAQLSGRTLVADGTEFLFFSGTSYLGIACDPQFEEHLQEGFRLYGTNYSSSRNSNLKLQVYDDVEAYLATFTGAEAALTISSGYLAGQALIQTLQNGDPFLYAPDAHPALWGSLTNAPSPSLTYDAWAENLPDKVNSLTDQHVVIVCNSLDPLKAQVHSFDWINSLPKHKKIILVIDDSHGLGITGIEGAGIFSQLAYVNQLPHIQLIVVASLGKAFGIPAGVILSNKGIKEQLQKSPYFGGASPAIPAYLHAFLRSNDLYSKSRKQLFSNTGFFLEQLTYPELFSYLKIYPVFYTQEKELYLHLLKHKILISSFRYPTPHDEPITRVVLNSLHTFDDIKLLTNAINEFTKAC